MYSSERANKIVTKDVAYLPAGIHDNVKLVGVRCENSPVQGNMFLEFKFEQDGKVMTHTEWTPTRGNLDETAFAKKCDTQFKRIEQILLCYGYTKEELSFNGESFKELCDWTIDHLNKADLNTLLRVKVIYNDKGYTALPKYATFTFIEPMSIVEEGKSVITKLGIDLFEKPVIADTEKSNPNPFSTAEMTHTESNNDPNGLPF